jgi:uncharacterized protein
VNEATPRNIYWRPWDEPGLEHLHATFAADGLHAVGLILRKLGDTHLRCRYELATDAAWRTRRLSFAIMESGETAGNRLVLESDGEGNWQVNGEPQPDLTGCLDPDIQITPFTNTLPIRRLGLSAKANAEIRVVYVPVPDLTPRPAEQRYTCLEAYGETGGRYRYDGLFRNFTADLPVDADALVIDYPETFRRVWPA